MQLALAGRNSERGDTLCGIVSRYFVDTLARRAHYRFTPFQI